MINQTEKLNAKQKQLVEDYFLLGMKIGNEYYNKNRDMILNKRLEKDDIDQIVCVELCKMAKYYDEDLNFATLVKSYLPSNVGSVVLQYNIIKIPRIDNWKLDMHKDNIDELSSITHNGIFELDKPSTSNDGSGDTFSELDLIPSDDCDSLERIELEDELASHFNKTVARSLILQSDGYSVADISKKLNVKNTTLTNWIRQAKIRMREMVI